MKRTLFCVVMVGVAAALAWTAQPADAASGYRIEFNVRLGNAIPSNAVITCKVRIMPQLAAGRPGMLAPMAEGATGVATVTGSVAHCAVEVPTTWAAADAHRAAVLSYEIDAATPAMVHSVAGQGMELPGGPAGSLERVELSMAL